MAQNTTIQEYQSSTSPISRGICEDDLDLDEQLDMGIGWGLSPVALEGALRYPAVLAKTTLTLMSN